MSDWLSSGAFLPLRILGGVTIFTLLALHDLRRRGKDATRWREYLFLFTTAAAAILYGALNDQVTSTISWEYFYYWKGLEDTLGPATPPEPFRLHWEAAKIGMQAAWSVGLIVAVVLLFANNPGKRLPRLPFCALYRYLPTVFLTTILCSALFAALGRAGALNSVSADLREEAARHRPERFMTTWGIHLGAYVGGPLGTVLAVIRLRRARRRLRLASAPPPRSVPDAPPSPTPA